MATKHGLNNDDAKIIKKERLEDAIEKDKLTPKETKIIKQIAKEMKAPIEFTDKVFKLGEGEIDIRKLSDENFKQMLFRQQCLTNIYLNSVSQSLVDLQRILFCVLKRLGSTDVVGELSDVIQELSEQYGRINGKQ